MYPTARVYSLLLLLAGCGTLPPSALVKQDIPAALRQDAQNSQDWKADQKGNDIVLYALSLIDSGYRYGGKNPEAGLDCSGMVSHIYEKAAGIRLAGSAADIAKHGRPVGLQQLRPGDLVFFNTLHRPLSHVGIYIGADRFVHAPSSNGRIRTESLKNSYFAARLETARSLFD